MPTFRITAPDGTKLKITGAEMPSEAELDNIFKSVGKPVSATPQPQEKTKSNWERFKSRLPDLTGITQVPAALRDLSQQPAGIVDKAISGAIGSLVDPVPQYKALRERGQTPLYSAIGSIPLIGPAADVVTQDIYNLRVPEMAGDAVSMAPALLGAKPVQNSKLMRMPVGEVASNAGAIAKDVAKGVANAASDAGTYVSVGSGAGTGYAVAGHPGAAIGAGISGAVKVGSDVWKSVKAGLMERKNISGAKAEAVMLKMAPEELSTLAEDVVKTPGQVSQRAEYKAKMTQALEEKRKAYWDAHPKPEASAPSAASTVLPERPLPRSENPDLQALTAEDIANAPGDVFKHGPEDAVMTLPLPKPKTGHVHSHGRKASTEAPPAPVEAAPAAAEPVKAASSASPGQNARDWLQKYSAADAEGRRALVKGLGGKMNYEDMRQLAAYTDDLATDAPKAPAVAEDHFRPVKLDHLKDAPVVDIPAKAAQTGVHPGYQALVDAVKGKTQAEALKILAEQEVSSFLAPGILERAGVKAPEVVSDVVTRPHPGQRSPAFVNDRLAYLQEQAAKRGDAPAKFAEQVAQNKTKGAKLAAMLEQPKTLHSGPRLGESDLDPATVAGIDANAQMLLKDIDASLQSRRGYKEGSHKIRSGDELDLVERIKRSPIKASDLESVLGYGRKDLEGHAKGIVHSSGKPLDTFIEEYLIPEGYVTDVADFGEKLGRALAGEKIFPNGANTGTGTAKAKVAEVAQLIGESPAKIRDALIRDKSNPVELKARRVLNRHDPYDAVAQAEEAYSRMNPDAEPPAGLVNDAPGFPWEKPTARQQGEALHAKAKARKNQIPDALFEEDHRLSNMRPDSVTFRKIRESNPSFDPQGDTVTVYRASIGNELRPNDYVAIEKKIATDHLKNLKERGEAGKVSSFQVPKSDLMMANDSTEFVYHPKPTARQQGEALHAKAKARGKGKPDQSDIVAKEPPPLGDGHYRAINEEKRAYQLAKGFIWDGENWVHPKYPGELWSSDVVPAPSRSAVMKELAKIRGTSVKAQDMYLERKMAHMAQERLKKAKE